MDKRTAQASTLPTMAVNLGGLVMHNPVTVASGTFGSGREYAKLWSSAELSNLGALTTKGVSLKAWQGNAVPRIAETASGMLNSVGLQNKGVDAFCTDDLVWLTEHAPSLPVIVNVCGHSIDEYAAVIARLEHEDAVAAYEINISCPNVSEGGMSFGTDPQMAAEVTARCRKATARPLFVKLTPNVTDITVIARAVEHAGADALSLINTVAGMAIDAQTRRPLLARGQGGLSGPAIKPVALYALHRCYHAVSIPLLGMGGISCASDAIEFFLAGARAVAVGTAHFSDPFCAARLADDISTWCADHNVNDVNELVGGLTL
jgi:dihydroorotate dehydrogenase (NAD+) catalytic subunit